MAVKTITITEDAYNLLKARKARSESFTDVISRIAKKRSLSEFVGCISQESADKIEKYIYERRKRHTKEHRARVQRIVAELRGVNGTS
ncbi:antitoxin VapB family protein [Candidatus Woesearchaeota archaeon]|nr:antitoxin VapB family protein [Candidatus Woesearchaeota archaeon]